MSHHWEPAFVLLDGRYRAFAVVHRLADNDADDDCNWNVAMATVTAAVGCHSADRLSTATTVDSVDGHSLTKYDVNKTAAANSCTQQVEKWDHRPGDDDDEDVNAAMPSTASFVEIKGKNDAVPSSVLIIEVELGNVTSSLR
jgi:hypothetical protein